MRARTRSYLAVLGAVTVAGVVAGVAQAPEDSAAPQRPADPAVAAAVTLQHLEVQADTAGLVAQQADEALLEHRDAATESAADRAEQALESLAGRQEPQLEAVAQVLGVDVVRDGGASPATATLTAYSARSGALRAVSFARAQLGKPYGYAGAGPRAYDCSGLTMSAYRAAHIGIGGHGATKQWQDAKRDHRLFPYRSARPGDLIFYGSPGAVYHVAIYVGHGRMIEAPYPGKRVREVAVRSAGRLAQVGRPA